MWACAGARPGRRGLHLESRADVTEFHGMVGNGPGPQLGQTADEWFTPWRFAAVLAALVCAVYPEVLLGQATFFHRDFAVFGYPLAYYHQQSFWRGEIPLWNPLNDCGVPFLAQWNTLTLYPLSLIYLLLPLSWSLGMFCLAHFFLAGMGMYFLAWHCTGNRFAGAVGGLVFTFNPLMLNFLMWPNNIAAMGWLPWVVLATVRAWKQGGRWTFWAALVGGLQMLSGAPEVILLSWVLLTAMCAGEMILASTGRWRMAARFLVVVVWVGGLAAAQLLPFLDLLSHSQRDRAFGGSMWAMPAWGWANLLVPLFRAHLTHLGTYAQPDQYWIASYYLGVGVAGFALLAIIFVRRPLVWLLGLLTAFCLVLALGDHGVLYPAIKRVLPGLAFMRYPIKFVMLPAVLIPLLAAQFVAYVLGIPASGWVQLKRGIVAAGVGLLLVLGLLIGYGFWFPFPGTSAEVAALNGGSRAVFVVLLFGGVIALRQVRQPRLEKAIRLGFLLVLFLDALTAGPRPNPTAPRWVYEPDLARKELHLDPPPRIGESRTMLDADAEANLPIVPMSNAVNQVVYNRLAIYANVNLLDDIPKVVGMYSLFLRESGDVLATLWDTPTPPAGLVDFLAVSHVNMPGKANQWQFRPSHLPWVTAGQKPVFADSRATLAGLAAPGFDPRQTVYLPLEIRPHIKATNASPVKLAVREFSAHRVRIEVEATAPALVVIAQAFYHPWRAAIDTQAGPVWRANHAFQAIEVPVGKHEVSLSYEDRVFSCGLVISLGSAILWLVAFYQSGKKRTPEPQTAAPR